MLAGLTVAIVAVPLAMALGIASGTTRTKGSVTAVIAGFLISFLGGSRVQIGGPTGAFVVVVYNVIAHGYDGLLIATMMAGVMPLCQDLRGLGRGSNIFPSLWLPVLRRGLPLLFSPVRSEICWGLRSIKTPGDFVEKWTAFWNVRESINYYAVVLSATALAVILILRRYFPQIPAFQWRFLAGSVVVYALHLPVTTIGSGNSVDSKLFFLPHTGQR